MQRVVVTGMGMVSSLGHCLDSSWKALLNHESGIRAIVDDPVLKNDKPYNLALVRDFDYKRWKVPVRQILSSMLHRDSPLSSQNANNRLYKILDSI